MFLLSRRSFLSTKPPLKINFPSNGSLVTVLPAKVTDSVLSSLILLKMRTVCKNYLCTSWSFTRPNWYQRVSPERISGQGRACMVRAFRPERRMCALACATRFRLATCQKAKPGNQSLLLCGAHRTRRRREHWRQSQLSRHFGSCDEQSVPPYLGYWPQMQWWPTESIKKKIIYAMHDFSPTHHARSAAVRRVVKGAQGLTWLAV